MSKVVQENNIASLEPYIEKVMAGHIPDLQRLAPDEIQLLLQAAQQRQKETLSSIHEEHLLALRKATTLFATALTPQRVAEIVLEHMIITLGAEKGAVVLLRPDGRTFEVLYYQGYTPEIMAQWHQFAIEQPLPLPDAIREKRFIYFNSLKHLGELYPMLGSWDVDDRGGGVIIPLLIEDNAVGGISLTFDRSKKLLPEEQLFVEVLALQCAQALDRARIYEVEQQVQASAQLLQQQLAFLAEASAILASSLDYATTLQTVTDLAVPQLADWCSIYLLTQNGTIEQTAIAHVDPAKLNWAREYLKNYPPDLNATTGIPQVIRTGQYELYPYLTDEMLVASARDEHHLQLIRELGLTSILIVPLVVQENVIGVLNLVTAQSGRHFQVERDVTLAQELARRAATAIENTRLYSEQKSVEASLRQQNEIIETVNQVGSLLSSQLNLQSLVQTITEAATKLSKAQFGAFFYNLIDERGESYSLYTLSGVPREAFSKFPMPRNTAVFAPTFLGEGIIRSDDITKDSRYGKNFPYKGMPEGHLPVRSYLAVPVISRSGKVLGGLFFGHEEAGVFTEYEEHLITGLVSQAAVALDNAHLYAEAETERRRFQTTLLSIGDAVIATDVVGKITLINAVAQTLTGWTEIEAIGLHLSEVFKIVEESSHQPIESPFEKVIREGKIVGLANHTLLLTKDGHEIPIDDSGAPIYNDAQQLIGVILVFRDITERKKAQADLQQHAIELANSNAELQKFNYMASHDLQEPMRKIQALSTRFQARYASIIDAEGQDYLKRIQAAASRAQSLVQDVLLYTKLARTSIDLATVDLNETLKAVLETLDEQIATTAATIDFQPLPTIQADALQLEHLFQNLIENAIKYYRPGTPPLVKIWAECNDVMCKIYVADNGIGFDNKYKEQIFDVFERLDKKQAGSGVGLAICRKIVERHGGTITAACELGQGATFEIRLPVNK